MATLLQFPSSSFARTRLQGLPCSSSFAGRRLQDLPSFTRPSRSVNVRASAKKKSEHDAFIGIGPQTKRRRIDGSSKFYDVFINHRGADVKETLARDLYDFLKKQGLSAFLDSEELELGDLFPSNIETAIRSSSVHIAIFSKRYAYSAWCLAELALMIHTDAKIIPVFYDVAPSDLRYIQNGAYAHAFAKYEEKGRYLDKLETWKESLQFVSVLTGYEFSKHKNDLNDLCKNIVRAVVKEVQNTKPLHVAEHSVGLNELVQHFESYCQLKGRAGENVNIIGIFGMGGVGKTTLARELFNKKRSQFDGACFLSDVREAYAKSELPSLQSKLLQDLVHERNVKFQSIEDGIGHLKHRLGSAGLLNFLIVIDDIDNMEQLDALLVRNLVRDKQNLVVVTTRDEGVLISAGITLLYNLKGMNRHDGKELFCWHAFSQPLPAFGYEDLVDAFVNVCGGLPLSLKVFGRHVFDRNQDYWHLELDKIRRVLPKHVKQSLKVSYDSLDREEKQIFMDIACFCIDRSKSFAVKIWKVSGWSAEHALQRLKEKCLVEEMNAWYGYRNNEVILKMHDHLRDLGREMAEEIIPRHLWRHKYLQSLELKGFQKTLAETNGRCFHSMLDRTIDAKITFFLGNLYDCAETTSLLWLEIELRSNELTCLPSWIPLQNLQCLKIHYVRLKRLWQNNVQAPSQLKELAISGIFLEEFPDLSKILNQLESVVVNGEERLIQGWSKSLKSNSESTLHGQMACNDIRAVQLTPVFMSSYFRNLYLFNNFKSKGTFALNKRAHSSIDVAKLLELNIGECEEVQELCLEGLYCLESIGVDRCEKLNCLELGACKRLKELAISQCSVLEKLCLEGLNCLETIIVDRCEKLQDIGSIEDLQRLKSMQLSPCTNFIHRLQRLWKLPSEFMTVIGRAADGAQSTLNSSLFSSVDGNHNVRKLYTGDHGIDEVEASLDLLDDVGESDCLSAIIVCAMVVVEISEDHLLVTYGSKHCRLSDVERGEWIATMVMTDQTQIKLCIQHPRHESIRISMLNPYGIKNACLVTVKKGQEWEAVDIFKRICYYLYKK